jgi:hypothetical protein
LSVILFFGEPGTPTPVLVAIPGATVSIGRPIGWQLGIEGQSELGVTTQLAGGLYEYETITARVVDFHIRRGRQHELNRNEAGRCWGTIINQDGALTPSNTSSPHYPYIRPMVPMKVQGVLPDGSFDLFNGWAEAWPASWDGSHRMGHDFVRFESVDSMKILNLATVTLSRGEELSGARINALLNAIGWPTTLRTIDQGASMVQGVTLEDGNVLQHIQDVVASESGQFFIARDGKAVFYDRFHATFEDEVNDTWGDSGDEKRYASLTTSYDDQSLWNRVIVTAPDLTDQKAENTVSQALFGGIFGSPRTLSVSTLLASTADMLDRANLYVTKYGTPKQRITSLTLDNASLDPEQWPRILPKDLHDRITVRKRPEGDEIVQPSFIEGINIDNDAGHWRITWNLSSTTAQEGLWQLGVAGRSELGVTTSLVG